MKRILLFVVTNIAVMLVLGIAASLLGVNRYLTANGLNLGSLLDTPSIRPAAHIYVGSKAPWHEITDDLPQHEMLP